MPSRIVVAGALIRDGALLVAQRDRPVDLAGCWELPGGKVDPGETEQHALIRELAEELGIAVIVGARLGADVALAPGLVLRAYRVQTADTPIAREHRALRWLRAADLQDVAWVPADRAWLPDLAALLR